MCCDNTVVFIKSASGSTIVRQLRTKRKTDTILSLCEKFLFFFLGHTESALQILNLKKKSQQASQPKAVFCQNRVRLLASSLESVCPSISSNNSHSEQARTTGADCIQLNTLGLHFTVVCLAMRSSLCIFPSE